MSGGESTLGGPSSKARAFGLEGGEVSSWNALSSATRSSSAAIVANGRGAFVVSSVRASIRAFSSPRMLPPLAAIL